MGYSEVEFKSDSVFLITGGAGFIGSNLCEVLLSRGYIVRCLDNFSTGDKKNIASFFNNENFTFIDGDIRDIDCCYSACDGADYVLHQAAWGSVPRSIKYPVLYEEINVKGTINLFEAAKQKGVKKIVYASSSSVYGDSTTLPKKEGSEGNVLSPYALTKKCNEEYGKLYSSLYGLHTVGLRYFNVFGRRQNPDGEYAAVIPKFIKQLINNETPTIYGDGKQSRDFTYIENIIEANLKACTSSKESSGHAFNIAFGGREYLIDVYNELCTALDKEISPKFQSDRPGDIKHSNADISKAKMMLDYAPEWDFSKGIRNAISWYMENL